MRNGKWTRRDLLKASTVSAAGLLFAEPLKATAPQATEVTPALIEAAKKEGKLSFYSALELNTAERLARTFEAKYPGIAVRVERSGAERIFSASRRSRAAASRPSTSPTRPIPRIISNGRRTTGWRRTFPPTSPGIFRPIRSIPTACMRRPARGWR